MYVWAWRALLACTVAATILRLLYSRREISFDDFCLGIAAGALVVSY
jgi:hypothetical protein